MLLNMIQKTTAQEFYIYKKGMTQPILVSEVDSLVFFKEEENTIAHPNSVDKLYSVNYRRNHYGVIPTNTFSHVQGGYIRYENGKYNSTNLSTYGMACTPFINIEGVKIVGFSRHVMFFGFYDVKKNYIQHEVSLTESNHDYIEVNVPNEAAYLRISFALDHINDAYLALGDGKNSPLKKITVGQSGFHEFRTIRAASEYANTYNDLLVDVSEGIYDLCKEYATEIANDHGHSASYWYGVTLSKGTHYRFSTGAKVFANYQGDNIEETCKHFCPFNAQGGFILENLWIEAGNSRYCVHDDYSGVTPGTQHHKFINCHMEYKTTVGNFTSCIGGGFGEYFDVEIVGCWFKAAFAEVSQKPCRIVSYHGSASYHGECRVSVRDCYFSGKGTYATTAYGPSEKVSISMVSGCSLGSAPYSGYETSDHSTPMNVSLISFNNEIRQ